MYNGLPKIWIAATHDTKAAEAHYIQDILHSNDVPVIMVDLSTSQSTHSSHAEVSAAEVASCHPHGPSVVFSGDRGTSVTAMAEAFACFIAKRTDVGALIGIGGTGGTAIITKAMRALPIGCPKIMVSTVASGPVAAYVGATDITMMHSVTDVAGLNRISKRILSNAAGAIAGAFKQSLQPIPTNNEKLAIGLTMFGVTTPCVQYVSQALAAKYEALIFHATGTGGQSMEKLLDNDFLAGILDLTTTEVCDFLFGGVLACTEDRFGSIARTRKPYVGSCGALDMVNFTSLNTVPPHYLHRTLYSHNSEVTLMRTTPEENTRLGMFIAERLNRCHGNVRFLIPEGGISALDAPGKPFWNPEADAALFDALEKELHQTTKRQLIRLPYHINDPIFAKLAAEHFHDIAQHQHTMENAHAPL